MRSNFGEAFQKEHGGAKVVVRAIDPNDLSDKAYSLFPHIFCFSPISLLQFFTSLRPQHHITIKHSCQPPHTYTKMKGLSYNSEVLERLKGYLRVSKLLRRGQRLLQLRRNPKIHATFKQIIDGAGSVPRSWPSSARQGQRRKARRRMPS